MLLANTIFFSHFGLPSSCCGVKRCKGGADAAYRRNCRLADMALGMLTVNVIVDSASDRCWRVPHRRSGAHHVQLTFRMDPFKPASRDDADARGDHLYDDERQTRGAQSKRMFVRRAGHYAAGANGTQQVAGVNPKSVSRVKTATGRIIEQRTS